MSKYIKYGLYRNPFEQISICMGQYKINNVPKTVFINTRKNFNNHQEVIDFLLLRNLDGPLIHRIHTADLDDTDYNYGYIGQINNPQVKAYIHNELELFLFLTFDRCKD